jgi:mannitol-specific phosphotransferase system IIBC component
VSENEYFVMCVVCCLLFVVGVVVVILVEANKNMKATQKQKRNIRKKHTQNANKPRERKQKQQKTKPYKISLLFYTHEKYWVACLTYLISSPEKQTRYPKNAQQESRLTQSQSPHLAEVAPSLMGPYYMLVLDIPKKMS